MTRSDWLSLLAPLVLPLVPAMLLVMVVVEPFVPRYERKPWTGPGYGRRRQTPWMALWRKDAGR